MSRKPEVLIAAICTVLALSACEGAKKQLGLERSAPDEFAVVKRAPLEMPPDYTLRPPRPGAPRPQESDVSEEAKQAVFGAEAAEKSKESRSAKPAGGESALLQQAGAVNANPDIRHIVDRETATMEPKDKPVAERLLGIKVGSSPEEEELVDPVKETERLRTKGAAASPAKP